MCFKLSSICFVAMNFGFIFSNREGQDYWHTEGLRSIEASLATPVIEGDARNAILFVGDGLGVTTATAARLLSGRKATLAWERFPHVGLLKTYSADKMVTDSAAAASALFTGVKANQYTAGVDSSVTAGDCIASMKQETHLEGLMHWAQASGKATGFVTTTRVTHATPSALFAHSADRKWECEATMPQEAKQCKDIARQLIEDEPGKNINVIMGGGRQCLCSNMPDSEADPLDTWSCNSRDGRNLIVDWKKDKRARLVSHQVLQNNEELWNMDADAEYTLGIFANGHLKLDYQRDTSPKGMPSLTNMTEKAIQLLGKFPNGYILIVEGGMIDQAHHRGHARQALSETLSMSEAVLFADTHTDPGDTLIVVTADHSHSVLITGYPDRHDSILGYTLSKIDGKPYTTLIYGTGGPNNYQFEVNEKNEPIRIDPALNDTTDYEYSQQALVLTDEVTHSGADVWAFARGPWSRLLHSMHEQTHVAYTIAYSTRIGPYKDRTVNGTRRNTRKNGKEQSYREFSCHLNALTRETIEHRVSEILT